MHINADAGAEGDIYVLQVSSHSSAISMATIFKTVTHHSKITGRFCARSISWKHFMEQGSYTPAYNFCRPGNGDTCFNFIKTLFKIRFDWTTKFPYPKQTMKTQITMLLTTLAIFDILFLFCTFPLFSLQAMMHFKNFLNLCVYKGEKLSNN